ncbi:MAG TPA: hypothetical protein VIB80_03615 [Aquiluna sp.]
MAKETEFSKAEQDAMKARAKELRAETKLDPLTQVLNAIEEMSPNDKRLAKKIHQLVLKHAPELKPKTWYGMPSYANKEGKALIFFQAASKFDSRLATLGISEHAQLDEGLMWPTSWSITKIDQEVEAQIVELIKRVARQHQLTQG